MGNHWHLVAEVEAMSELSRWMHWICDRHVRMVHRENRSLGRGHIYQGRYKSFPIQDESYLYNVLLYVEGNPLRAKLVSRAQDWPWSSLSRAAIRNGLIEVSRPSLRHGIGEATGLRRSTTLCPLPAWTPCDKVLCESLPKDNRNGSQI